MTHKLYRYPLRGIKSLWKALEAVVFPPFCLHCDERVEHCGVALCAGCQTLLELLAVRGRCPRCFACGYDRRRRWCQECCDRPFFLVAAGAAFDYEGPAKALVGLLKRHEWPKMARAAAGSMVAQMLALGWPIPDLIVPVPISRGRKFFRGYNQAELLARGMGEILKRPVSDCLWRPTDLPKTRLSRRQRLQPKRASMKLLQEPKVRDAVVLLVDDVWTTGGTLQESAQALLAGFPRAIYAMTLCRTPAFR